MADRKDAFLRIENLSVQYGEELAISGIDINIPKSTVTAVLGLSGVGKTSLLNAISDIIEYSGDVFLDGKDIKISNPTVGYVGQDFGILRWKTVKQNILLGRKIKKQKQDSDFLKSILESLKIENLKERYPESLSGGQRQRVKLASVFYLLPDIMLLDEPFSKLDMVSKKESQSLLKELLGIHHPTVLLVTHDFEEAHFLGDRIVVFSHDGLEIFENDTILKTEKKELLDNIIDMMKGEAL